MVFLEGAVAYYLRHLRSMVALSFMRVVWLVRRTTHTTDAMDTGWTQLCVAKFRVSGAVRASRRGAHVRLHQGGHAGGHDAVGRGRPRTGGGHPFRTPPAPPTIPCTSIRRLTLQCRLPPATFRQPNKHPACDQLVNQRPLHLCRHSAHRPDQCDGRGEVARPPSEQPPLLATKARRQGTG